MQYISLIRKCTFLSNAKQFLVASEPQLTSLTGQISSGNDIAKMVMHLCHLLGSNHLTIPPWASHQDLGQTAWEHQMVVPLTQLLWLKWQGDLLSNPLTVSHYTDTASCL